MSTVTLNRNCDFRRLYYRGRSYTNPALVVYFKKSGAGICRIGITVSKKSDVRLKETAVKELSELLGAVLSLKLKAHMILFLLQELKPNISKVRIFKKLCLICLTKRV